MPFWHLCEPQYDVCGGHQNTKLKNEADSSAQRLERTLAMLTGLEDQAEQHGRVHNKMAARLKAMDDHAQNQAAQVREETRFSLTVGECGRSVETGFIRSKRVQQ
jgi:hypothetical protein